MKRYDYDITVLGAGSGGLNIASFTASMGLKTLLIDRSKENIGGDCLNYGCIPSKSLLSIAKKVNSAHNSESYGLDVSGKINFKKIKDEIIRRQNRIREHENQQYLERKGMSLRFGSARFSGKNSITIGEETITSRKIVIATGSRPRIPDIPGIGDVNYLTNETIFSIDTLPGRLLIVGGGPIGVEMAQAFSMLGSKVIMINSGKGILAKEDEEISEILKGILEKQGVEIIDEANLRQFPNKKSATVRTPERERTIKFDDVLISVGRELNIDGLDLDRGSIKSDDGKIMCDDELKTSNSSVYLCGDVAGNFQFTHAAEVHASIILNNLISPFKKKLDADNMAWVTFTEPELATFGKSESQLQAKGNKYQKIELDLNDDDRSVTEDSIGKAKLYLSGGKILGGTILARGGGEVIQELLLAKGNGMRFEDLMNKVYPYPTASRINKMMLLKHLSVKLKPWHKNLIRVLFRSII